MKTAKVSELAESLRALADSAKRRLWIASPYIGSWKAVRTVLGSTWQKVDVRLLTDKDSGILAQDTIEHFAEHRPVQSLLGLHAKLYIVDDAVLLTSANLTEAAFTRRYEAGLVVRGAQARKLIAFYEALWSVSLEMDLSTTKFTKRRGGNVDEPRAGSPLPKLFSLPPAPSGSIKSAGAFADYPYFLDTYRRFANDYLRCGARDNPRLPLFLETDKFLNYLFHDDLDKPSQAYKSEPFRHLSDAQRLAIIKKYRARFRRAGLGSNHHAKTSKLFRRLLGQSKIMLLTHGEIETIAGSLNCFGVLALAKAKFLNNNDPKAIRQAWFDLLHGTDEVKLRMNNCYTALFGFGKAANQEMLGYYYPDKFPLRNENTNSGLRFLGYNV